MKKLLACLLFAFFPALLGAAGTVNRVPKFVTGTQIGDSNLSSFASSVTCSVPITGTTLTLTSLTEGNVPFIAGGGLVTGSTNLNYSTNTGVLTVGGAGQGAFADDGDINIFSNSKSSLIGLGAVDSFGDFFVMTDLASSTTLTSTIIMFGQPGQFIISNSTGFQYVAENTATGGRSTYYNELSVLHTTISGGGPGVGDAGFMTADGPITSASTMTALAVTINGGAPITGHLTATASLDFSATAAGACDLLTVTVAGAADGDPVSLGVPTALAASDNYQNFTAYVSAANTVTVKRCNLLNLVTALSNPAAATVRVDVWKN